MRKLSELIHNLRELNRRTRYSFAEIVVVVR